MSRAPIWLWLATVVTIALANVALAYARGVQVHETRANHIFASILGAAMFATFAWFLWAQWGYHQVNCSH